MAVETKLLVLIIQKVLSKRVNYSMKVIQKIEKSEPNPLAITRCPHCNHVGLTLLTSSTKEQLSPRFNQKILQLLPSKSEKLAKTQPMTSKYNITTSCAITEHNGSKRSLGFQEVGSPDPREIRQEEISLVMYSEDQIIPSPKYNKKLKHFNEISEIKLNLYENSLDSPGVASSRQIEPRTTFRFNESTGNRAPKDEISFEFNYNFTELPKDLDIELDLSLDDFPKNQIKVPKLDFSELLPPKQSIYTKKPSLKVFHKKYTDGFLKLHDLFLNRTKLGLVCFKMIIVNEEQSLTFDFSKDDIQNSDIIRSPALTGTFGNLEKNRKMNLSAIEIAIKEPDNSLWFEYQTPSQTQKTAYKICHARLEKFIYRRKMQAFFCLSDYIYNMPSFMSSKRNK